MGNVTQFWISTLQELSNDLKKINLDKFGPSNLVLNF
jgi:hypothetical protein